MSLFRQSIALVLTTKNNDTKLHTLQTQNRNGKTTLANKTVHGTPLIWYTFYNLRPGNRPGPILTAPESTLGSGWFGSTRLYGPQLLRGSGTTVQELYWQLHNTKNDQHHNHVHKPASNIFMVTRVVLQTPEFWT